MQPKGTENMQQDDQTTAAKEEIQKFEVQAKRLHKYISWGLFASLPVVFLVGLGLSICFKQPIWTSSVVFPLLATAWLIYKHFQTQHKDLLQQRDDARDHAAEIELRENIQSWIRSINDEKSRNELMMSIIPAWADSGSASRRQETGSKSKTTDSGSSIQNMLKLMGGSDDS